MRVGSQLVALLGCVIRVPPLHVVAPVSESGGFISCCLHGVVLLVHVQWERDRGLCPASPSLLSSWYLLMAGAEGSPEPVCAHQVHWTLSNWEQIPLKHGHGGGGRVRRGGERWFLGENGRKFTRAVGSQTGASCRSCPVTVLLLKCPLCEL